MSWHPDSKTLRRLVAGDLDPPDEASLLEHLSECGDCLEVADHAWEGISGLAESLDVPPMSDPGRERVERRLFRNVHAAHLGTQVSWLATEGFVRVLVVLLRPFSGGGARTDEEGWR